MTNLPLASINQSARIIAQSAIPQNASADTVKTPADKPIDKEQALKMLNDFLNKSTNKDNSYPQVYVIATPLKEREFFTNMNNPYSYPDYNGKPNVVSNTIVSTTVSYFVMYKAVEHDTRINLLGYETTATLFQPNNWAKPLVMTSTLPESMLKAYNNGKYKTDLGNIYCGHLIPTAMIGDGLYDLLDKIPPKERPLMAGFALYGMLNPRAPLLWDMGNQYSIINYTADGLNTSNGVVTAFVGGNLLVMIINGKIKYVWDTFLGKNPTKPKEGNITTGSWMQGNTGFTGFQWKF